MTINWPLVAIVGIVCLTIAFMWVTYLGAKYDKPEYKFEPPKSPQMSRTLPDNEETQEWPQRSQE